MDLLGTRIRPADGHGGFRIEVRKGKRKEWFDGDEARRLAGQILPAMNRGGAKCAIVRTAVDEIERLGHPERFLFEVTSGDRFQDKKGIPGYVNKMPHATKLALEMVLHEEDERRALAGELWRLERAWEEWEEAEEIAAISDSLLLPDGTDEFLSEPRPASGPPAGSGLS